MVDYKFFIGIAIPQFRHHSSMASPTRRLSCDEWNGKFNTAMQSECMQHVYLNYFHTWIDENQRNQWALHRHLLNTLYDIPPKKWAQIFPFRIQKRKIVDLTCVVHKDRSRNWTVIKPVCCACNREWGIQSRLCTLITTMQSELFLNAQTVECEHVPIKTCTDSLTLRWPYAVYGTLKSNTLSYEPISAVW